MSHEGFRFDDRHICAEFWYSINKGYVDTEDKWEFEKFWGKGAKPERIVLSQTDFDALVERLELPSEETMESVRKLMNRKTPFDND